MTTGVICTPPILQFTLNNGQLAAGGSILTQVGGTNAATYQDQPLTTPLPNPIPLNSRGEISNAAGASCQLFLTANTVYTFTLFDGPNGTGNQVWVATYVNGIQVALTQAVIGLALNPQTAAEIAAGVTPTNTAYTSGPITDVRRYGYTADNATLNDTVFAAIIAVAKAAPGMAFQFPAGQAIISKALNLSQFGATPIIWKGAGFDANQTAGTTIVARTAADGTLSPGWIADFTGSQNITLKELNFYGTGTNAATKGLLFGRSFANQFAQQVHLEKVVVSVGVSAAASSLGSLGVVNVDAEQFVDDHCSYFADTPYVGLLDNEINVVSPYVASTGHSDTGGVYVGILSHTITEHRQITYNALTNAAMSLYGVADSIWTDCVWARSGSNSSNTAIQIVDGVGAYAHCQALNLHGQIEGFPVAIGFNTAGGAALRIKTQLLLVAPTGLPYVQTAAGYTLTGCELDNMQISNAGSSGSALSCGTGSVLNAGEIMVYPNMTGPTGTSLVNNGCRINYNGNGTGLASISPGANIASLGTPNAAQSLVDSEGYIHLTGILQSSAAITSGTTLATIVAAHRPNRSVSGAAFLSGTGLVFYTITSAGLVTIGTNISGTGIQLTLDGITFRQTN